LAALDRSNAAVKAWDPRPNQSIAVITVSGDTVYVSGDDVRTIAPEPRGRVASFNGTSLTTFAPNLSGGNVHALAFSGTTLYAGGDFDTVGTAMRQSVAAIDGNGAATAWNAHLSSMNVVDAVLVDDTRVYVGGQFEAPSNRSNLAAFTKTDGAVSTNWNPPSPDDYVHALALDGTTLYAGGEFLNLGGTARARLVAIDGSGAIVTGWNPGAGASSDDKVNALVVGGDNIFVGGSFTSLGGQTRNRLGAVDKAGTLAAFDPNLSCPDASTGDPCEVTGLAFSSGFLYAGGQFSQLGTGPDASGRSGTAQWDSSLNVTPWARNVVGSVFAINVTSDNSHIYVVGNFFSIANQAASDYFVATSADTE
jgi:trimeric autotransporter adhesin